MLSGKNARALKKDMVINLSVGFQDLDDPNHKGQVYSLLLIDTLRVNEGGAATFLTDRVRGTNDMAFFFKMTKRRRRTRTAGAPSSRTGKVTPGGKVLRNKNRGAALDETAAEKMKMHQKEHAKQKQEDGLARFAAKTAKATPPTKRCSRSSKLQAREPASHQGGGSQNPGRSPSSVGHPSIYGYAVPFHINTLKNVSKSDEGEYTYLRLNFVTPGQIAGKKEDVPFDDPDATLCTQHELPLHRLATLSELYREITELRKSATKREAEEKELADVVEQDKLILSKSRAYTLPEVFPRPAMEGKRVPGDLTIHQNGLRFSSRCDRIRGSICFSPT